MNVLRLAAVFTVLPLGASLAQQPSTCDIDEGKPQKVALASFNLQRAFNAAKPEDKAKILRDVVKGVTEEDKKMENPSARALLIGKAMILFAAQPELVTSPTRGGVGFATNPGAAIDLLVTADSLFTLVERTNPGCTADLSQWRHQAPWFKLIQASFSALQAQQFDSAAALARRSMVINRTSAYAPYVMATVAANAKDLPRANAEYRRAIELAATDTAYADIKRRSTFEIGRMAADQMELLTGAQKTASAKEAIRAFTWYLAEVPSATDAPAVRNSLVDLYVIAGDSASVPSIYADMIANPKRYDDIALTQAGVIPTRFNRSDDAAKLFAAALENNPYQRDALSNLAAMYFALNRFQDMIPVVDRLVKIDPSNPDNWLLYAFAYQGLQRAAKDLKLKKALGDSLIKYNKRSEDLPLKVNFTGFTRSDTETSLTGSVENRGKATASYSLTFEFVDRAGAVLATETVKVSDVVKGATKPFSLKVVKGGITGYRYTQT